MQTLAIDLETFSSVDLTKSGVYRYCESPDFEILLFGYSIDGGAVEVIDLASGERIPQDILAALEDDAVTKWAFNAQFERVCLSRYLGYPPGNYLDPESWRCSMIWAAYMGLPLSLEGVGAVLGLERQKLREGKDLIKLFCSPCAPTKTNGWRKRNLPRHLPEKWELFRLYNRRDVEVECSIKDKLAKFPVPEFVWDEYHLDQEINDRGVRLDMDLVHAAIEMDSRSRAELTAAMRRMTELDNPNSVQQMKQWLLENGLETDTLGKKAVAELMKTAPPELREVLTLRQQLAKSSVKKYQAMEKAVCADGRARGMFQFYGANRTGRWCLTGDHEVLTDQGWQRLDEWRGGKIACWNPNGETVSFQKASALEFPYDGVMYEYVDKRISQLSTPDHKMYVKKRYGGSWEVDTVENMATYRPSIPFTGYRQTVSGMEHTKLRVLVMVQADGHYAEDGSVILAFTKLRKVERCKHLLRSVGISFVYRRYQEKTQVRHQFKIFSRDVPFWLRTFRNKTFDTWLFDESADVFFDELVNWDGYQSAKNSIQYSTCNQKNADIVQAFAHISGRAAQMKVKRRNEEHPNWNDAYVLDIWLTPKNCHEIRNKPTISRFHGTVYCAETPTGFFLVRRNGRVWVTGNSGRLIQMQNLPQNHLPDLDVARSLVRMGDYAAVKMLYTDVPDTLSQLIRTAFIPRDGAKFIVADFSAIEARVIAWYAGEQWRQEVFANGGDIYCASASAMFHVPVEKHGVNGHLRQKGKVAELACIAEGEPVLTNHGLIPIEEITKEDLLWDGKDWVSHEGVVCRGEREVITYDGLTATADHLVFVEGETEPVHFGFAAACGAHLIQTGDGGRGERHSTAQKTRVYDIRNAGKHHRFTVSGTLVHNCGYGGGIGAMKAMGGLELGLSEEDLQETVRNWRAANPRIVEFWWAVDRAVKNVIKTKQPEMTHGIRFHYQSGFLFITLPSGRRLAYVKPRIGVNRFGGESITYEGVGGTKKWERLESYGPKFVENIVQATARDILCYAMKTLRCCAITMHIHDELVIEADPRVSLSAICEQMGRTPPWAKGLLLRADGYECDFYKKD